MSINRAFLAGNIGREIKERRNGDKLVVSFSLATDRYKGNGEKPDTDWHKVVVFGVLAETVLRECKSGNRITVEGNIRYRSYIKTNETANTWVTEIIADRIFFSSSPKSKPAKAPTESQDASYGDDDYEL